MMINKTKFTMNNIAIIIFLLSIVSFGGAAAEEVEMLSTSCSNSATLLSPTCDGVVTTDIGNESRHIKQQPISNISDEEEMMDGGEVIFATTIDSWWKEYDSDDEIYQKLDLYKEYECTINHDRPVPTTEDYMIMRQAYIDAVGPKESSIAIPDSTTKDGFLVPHEAHANDKTKGRGIFATEFIPKGTKMYQYGISGYAIFYDGNQYRKFLSLIPKEFACDVLIWSYADYDEENDDEVYISVELDDSALCNDDLSSINKTEWNFGCDTKLAQQYDIDCEEYAIALQDIYPGQEILCNYENFHSWEAWFALLGLS